MGDNFNYFDELRNGNSQDWISYLNKKFINFSGPPVKIFKLDKENSTLDEVYIEVNRSRIYLPPFEMRAYHLDNTWTQVVGEGTMPYLETQENIQFVFNFQEVVDKHRQLKSRHSTDMYITYTGNKRAQVEKNNNILMLYVNNSEYMAFDLTNNNYNTVKKLTSQLSSIPYFTATMEGDNSKSTYLVSFNKTRLNNKVNIFVPDKTFSSITDVIEAGDVILTHKFWLYEVLQNKPGGDFGWDYATFIVDANLRTLDEAQLPQNFINQIAKKEYGLRGKFKLEGEIEI